MPVELTAAVDGIDGSDDGVYPERVLQGLVPEQGVQDGGGVREPGGLDDGLPERRNRARCPPLLQRDQSAHEIVADGAAQTARVQQDRFLIEQLLHQQVIDADLSELVDEHRGVAHLRMAQQRVQQRGLAAPEEAGNDGDRGCRPRLRRQGASL